MKGWKELGLKPTHDFFIMLFILYKKNVLNEEDISLLMGNIKSNFSYDMVMDYIEKNF